MKLRKRRKHVELFKKIYFTSYGNYGKLVAPGPTIERFRRCWGARGKVRHSFIEVFFINVYPKRVGDISPDDQDKPSVLTLSINYHATE